MTSSLASAWSLFDKLIEWLRFREVRAVIPSHGVLVDLGCGDGKFLRSVASHISYGIGIDSNVDSVRSGGNVLLVEGNLEGIISIDDDFADVVTSLAVLEHLNCADSMIKESMRILKNKGTLVITTPAPIARPILEILAFRLNLISKEDISDHKHYYTKKELVAILGKFSSVKYRRFLFGLNQIVVAVK